VKLIYQAYQPRWTALERDAYDPSVKTTSAFTALVLCASLVSLTSPACSSDSSSAPASTPPPTTPATCAVDERAAADGTCELLVADAASCGPGTRPAVGVAECVPVGTTSCAPGFARDPSGWGCAAVLPPAACTGATRPKLGETTCAPVGDCAAPFPPAGAILVDPTLAPGAVDATHVLTVADALAVATSGATIALADGAHTAAPFTVGRPLTLVGRCPASAHLVAAQPPAATGISITANATLRGLTLDGFTQALLVSGAVTLDAEDLVIENARSRAVYAQRGAKVTMRRSVMRGTAPIGRSDQTLAVLVGTSATVTLEDSAILASLDGAVAVTDNVNTSASLTRTVIQDTKPRADGKGGGAVRAFQGARLTITESAILDSTAIAVLALRHEPAPPPKVTISRSVIARTVPSSETGTAIGTAVNAAYDAIVTLDETTVADSQGTGLYVAEKAKLSLTKSVVVRVTRTPDLYSQGASSLRGATLDLQDSAVVKVGGSGVGGWNGGHVTMTRSLVRDIGGDVAQMFTLGQGLSALEASTIDATDSAVVDALELGVTASKPGSAVRLQGVLVTRTDAAPVPRFGHGMLSVDSATITLVRGIVEHHVGVGLFYASGGGVASGSLVRSNAVGVHAQDGSSIAESDAAPDAVPEQSVVVTKDTHFVGNATRIGAGVLPLPAPLADPPPPQ
jgi:hypothetical protein